MFDTVAITFGSLSLGNTRRSSPLLVNLTSESAALVSVREFESTGTRTDFSENLLIIGTI